MLQIHSWRETPESAFGNRLSKLAKAEKAFAERDAKAQKGNHREETDPPSSKPVSLTVHKRCLLHGALFLVFSVVLGTNSGPMQAKHKLPLGTLFLLFCFKDTLKY